MATMSPPAQPGGTLRSADKARLAPPHVLDMASPMHLARVLWHYGFSPRYLPRVAFFALRSLPGIPFRILDRCLSWRRVRHTRLEKVPLFIIGHWRSGTTHLHNLLGCDPQFGLLTTFHSIASESFLGVPGLIRRLVSREELPATRPMDEVRLSLDTPQEEEMLMARLSVLSWDHSWIFPQKMREIFDRAVLFEGSPKLARQWQRTYDWMLRRLSLSHDGKRLCLKNPPNTARIRQLLELYPDARFVHVYRNPYVVYRSMMHMWTTMTLHWALQPYERQQAEDNLVYFYQRLMYKYFEDAPRIPAGRLVEMKFEDLEADPLGELARLYRELSLEGFEQIRPRLESYLAGLGDYRKNEYRFSRDLVERVQGAWGFTLKRWDYEPPAVC